MHERRFWWYFRLQAVSTFFNNIHALALPLWYFETTGSRFESALVFAISGLVSMAVLPFVGTLIDRWSNRRLLLGLECTRTLAIAALAVVSREPTFWSVTTIACLSSICATLFAALQQAIIKRNVTADQAPRAQSLLSAIQGCALIVAPSAGALMVSHFGYSVVFALNSVSFLFGIASAWAVAPGHPGDVAPTTRSGFWTETRVGLAVVVGSDQLRPLVALSMVNAVATGSLGVLYVQLFAQVGYSMQWIALLMAAQGVGIVLGSRQFAKNRLVQVLRPGVLGIVSGASLLVVAALTAAPIVVAMGALVIAGSTAVLLGISLRTAVQQSAPAASIGRVSALLSFATVGATFSSIAFLTSSTAWLSSPQQLLAFGLFQLIASALIHAWPRRAVPAPDPLQHP